MTELAPSSDELVAFERQVVLDRTYGPPLVVDAHDPIDLRRILGRLGGRTRARGRELEDLDRFVHAFQPIVAETVESRGAAKRRRRRSARERLSSARDQQQP